MKRIFSVFLGVCFFSVLLQGIGLSADPGRIGVVDMQKFQKNSKSFQKTTAALKKKFDSMQQKLDEEKDSLFKLEEDFKKQSMMLSLDAQENKTKELEKKRRYYKFLYDESTQEMKDAEVEALRKITKELEKIVQRIGEKEGYGLIVEKKAPGIIFSPDAIDITDRVTDAYDKANP